MPHTTLELPQPIACAGDGHARLSRTACLGILLACLAVAAPSQADTITGTNDSDNNSFSFFPVWRAQINGTPRDDTINGLNGDDLIYGRDGNDNIHGDRDSDRIYGEAGNDSLYGGVDYRDVLYGGPGNDVYYVFDYRDVVVELAGEGVDTVLTTVNYTLPSQVEDLFFSPFLLHNSVIVEGSTTASIVFAVCSEYTGSLPCRNMGTTATGNSLSNEIRGNGLDNTLFGVAGNDLLLGGRGSDTLRGGAGNDVLEGFAADGRWWTHEYDTLTGDGGADVFVIGISERPEGVSAYRSSASSERFPQYLGQGKVYITDFNWREGDKIEVFGEIGNYRVDFWGTTALIYWDGWELGYGANELVGVVYNIMSSSDLIPALDFI